MSDQTIAILYLISVILLFSYCAGRLTDASFGSDNWYVVLGKGFVKLCVVILIFIISTGSLMLAGKAIQVLST